MAIIDNINVSDLGPGLGGLGKAVLDDVKERVIDQVRRQGWIWFNANKDRVLYTQKFLFWKLNLRVADLRFVFIELLGREPLS